MIRFLRLFRWFREIEEAAGSRDSVIESLREEVRLNESLKTVLDRANTMNLAETARRVAAEAIASERRTEIDRMLDTIREMREDLKAITGERLRSIDAINLKLMEAKTPEPLPDMDKYKVRPENLNGNRGSLINDIRAKYRQIDMEILKEARKGFPNRRRLTMNADANQVLPGVIPSIAEIESTDISDMVNQETAA